MKSLSWMVSYILISLSAVALAMYLSSSLMGTSHAQSELGSMRSPVPPSVKGQPPPQSFESSEPLPPPPVPPEQTPEEFTQSAPPPSAPPAPMDTIPDGLMDSGMQPTQQTAISISTDDFVLDTTGIRDPFRPYRSMRVVENPNDPTSEQLDPLQTIDLDSLELVAVLWDVHNPRALVRSKAGTMYTLKRNTKVGRNNGVVAGIREGEVIVLESIEEDGRTLKRYSSIKMATTTPSLTTK